MDPNSVENPNEEGFSSPSHHFEESPYPYADEMDEEEAKRRSVISVGVCAMSSKTMSNPMQNILHRLQVQDYIKIVMFSDKDILEEPIEKWPTCDCLIAFYSQGFPLEKAIEYVKLRKPMVFNDLEMQFPLMDRREVYKILNANGVETPRYEVCNRDEVCNHDGAETSGSDGKEGGESCDGGDVKLNEMDDILEINGTVFHKPFVEKPVSAEDHNIYIYFPSDYGGGSQRLFRKVKNKSSIYSKESSVREKGSYIYEDFLATDGTDVKVYTVGPDYAHAEARKSPALDGKVERDESGKEVRYPVILTAKEKLIARAVCLAFKQTVCGFDLLRANGKSYVCDVNGFSFVKNSQKYYDDCAQILLEMITIDLGPQFFPSIPPSVEYLMDEIPDIPVPIPLISNNIELRCVVGVIRHGDRTPKQKMKMIVKHKRFFDFFKEHGGYKTRHLKIKKPKLLQRVLDIARDLLASYKEDNGGEIQEKIHKLEQLRSVLEMYGTFSGINRKVQFKLLNKKDHDGAPLLLLILKWGGEHTQSGRRQAEELGRAFRIIYPGGEGEYASLPGSGFLRLHSTYRHDLKVYASDEGRVQMTAAAFTKGLLDLEGNPASVLVHLVKRDQAATNMLDTSTDAQEAMNSVKERLHDLMRSPDNFTEKSYEELVPTKAETIVNAMRKVGNPRQKCEELYSLIQVLIANLKTISESEVEYELYHEESFQLMLNRWGKLEKDFKLKDGQFDISKIPDIYDCIKFDLLHNSELILDIGKELIRIVMPLADIVMPQEYGITKQEKLDISHKICGPLLRKIQADFHHTIVNEQADVLHRLDHRLSKGVISPKRHVRTRLYFTSESHVHSLWNILKYEDFIQPSDEMDGMEGMRNVPELNYLTQIVFLLFEDLSQPEKSDHRYRVFIHFSPGVRRNELIDETDGKAKLSPEMSSRTIQSQIVKRLSGNVPDSQNVVKRKVSAPLLLKSSNSVSSETPEMPRSKELVVRRLSEVAPNQRASSSTSSGWKMSSWTSGGQTQSDGRIKSFSETEILAQRQKRSTCALQQLKEGLPITTRSRSMNAFEDIDKEESKPHDQFTVRKSNDLRLSKGENSNALKVGSTSPTPTIVMEQGSSEKLNKQDAPKTSPFGERGLVLATDLASTINQLSPIAVLPLSRMNDYLTSITGIHLDYELIIDEEPPPLRVRTPTRVNSGVYAYTEGKLDSIEAIEGGSFGKRRTKSQGEHSRMDSSGPGRCVSWEADKRISQESQTSIEFAGGGGGRYVYHESQTSIECGEGRCVSQDNQQSMDFTNSNRHLPEENRAFSQDNQITPPNENNTM